MNKTLIHGAVGAALTLGLGLPSAQAYHQMLIPYVVKDANRTTIVTLIGRGQPESSGTTLHLQYWTKSTTDANTAACQPNSMSMPFTDNDIVTFDTAGLLGYPLFGDTTNSAPFPPSIVYTAPRHGYLLVEWMTKFPLAGYWLELDLGNGGAHGDWALIAGYDANDFSLADDHVSLHVGEIVSELLIGGPHPVAFWPTSVATSVFTVTPLGTSMQFNDNNRVVMHVRNSANLQGTYDRNENLVDGTVPQTVRCVGRLTLAQLIPGVMINVAWAASGGWGWLLNLGDGDTDFTEGPPQDLPAVVYQVDTGSGTGAGTFLQNATRIVSNTFILEKEIIY